jgi:serine/threonine protein kinase
MQQMQSLLQTRSEMAVLQELKLGPLLGRGSYGRVHRARWKSAIVAVKIIEHHGDGSKVSSGGKRINVGREGLLSTTMSHPNVVQTYHISTMSVGERAALVKSRESARNPRTVSEQVRGDRKSAWAAQLAALKGDED